MKLDLYRRLARAATSGDIDGLRDELRERFGPLPAEAETLLDMARLRVLGAVLGLQHVLVRGDEARLTFRAGDDPAARRPDLGARRRAARRRSAADGARSRSGCCGWAGSRSCPALVRALKAAVK